MSRAVGQNSVTPWGNDMNFRLARDQAVLLEIAANLRKANDFFAVFSSFELGGIQNFVSGNIKGLRETKLTVSLRTSH